MIWMFDLWHLWFKDIPFFIKIVGFVVGKVHWNIQNDSVTVDFLSIQIDPLIMVVPDLFPKYPLYRLFLASVQVDKKKKKFQDSASELTLKKKEGSSVSPQQIFRTWSQNLFFHFTHSLTAANGYSAHGLWKPLRKEKLKWFLFCSLIVYCCR